MTPEISDIPWRLHGQVKEVAEYRNVTTKQAYQEVIREGLESMEMAPIAQEAGTKLEAIGPISLEDRETNPIHSTPMDQSGWMYAYSFADLDFTAYRQPMTFSITDNAFDGSRDNLHDTMGVVAQTLPQAGDNGFFAIQQETKEWYGKGLTTFWEALSTRHQRHEGINTSGEKGEENAVYICDTSWGALCLSLQDGINHRDRFASSSRF